MIINLFMALSMLISASLFSADSHHIIIEDDKIQLEESTNRLDHLPQEILRIIAEYLPPTDIGNLELSLGQNHYHVKEIYWKKKAKEDFGEIGNKTIQKSIQSALGKRKRKNLPQGYEETKYFKLALIYLKKNVNNLLSKRVLILPYNNNISRTYFQKADFIGKNLSGYILCEGNYTDASFSQARLEESDLRWTKCTRTNFCQAVLVRAKLSKSDFSYANFAGADLTGANFLETELGSANFAGANVTDALFPDLSIFTVNFEGAFFFSCRDNQIYKNMLNTKGEISYSLLIE